MSDLAYQVIDTLGNTGSIATPQGPVVFDDTGTATVADRGLADEIKAQHPYLEVVPFEQLNPVHRMRQSQWPGMPWHKYDERGRIIKDGNLDTESPAPPPGG